MTTLKDKLISKIHEISEYHHSGEDQVIYVDDEEQIDKLVDSILQVINSHNSHDTYCVEVQRESEEPCVLHYTFDHSPTRSEILELIMEEDMGYDDNYGKFEYYKI